jgi:hypothetical protein
LISDGISDCFESEKMDTELQYNGYGIELYMEFERRHEFDDFKGHYAHAIMHQLTQNAISHGKFVDLFKELGPISIQLSGLKLPEKFMFNNDCGLLMNVRSKNIPPSIKLNKEEVILAGCRLLLKDELKDCCDERKKDFRKKLEAKFIKNKTFCYSPFVL